MEEHEFLDRKGGNVECPGQWMKKDLQKDIKFWSFRIEIEDKVQKNFSREEPGHIGRIRIRITSDFSLAMLGTRESGAVLYKFWRISVLANSNHQRQVLKKCTGKV